MEQTTNPVVLNLNKICRACLNENADMKNMLNSEHTETNLVKMFGTITSIELNNSSIGTICSQCEKQLIISYNFQQQCRKSDTIILSYIESSKNVKEEVAIEVDEPKIEIDKQKIEAFDEVLKQDSCDENFEKNSDDSDYEPNYTKPSRVEKKTKDVKQTMRLTQYPYDEVTQAINESQRKFYENTECIRCGFIGNNTRALSVHMSHVHKDLKERWCAQCNGEFDDLTEHVKVHENDLKCQFCEKTFQAKGHLTEHLRSHSVVRPYKCECCDKCFVSPRHLRVHFRIHTNERPYKCRLCTRAFIQQTSLKSHLKQHEKERSKKYCNTCNTNFKNELAFTKHTCSPDNSFIENNKEQINMENSNNTESLYYTAQNYCGECNKKVRSLLLHNRQVHSGDSKEFNEYGDNVMDNKLCTVCGKQFKTASKLKVHMRVHTGEAPYKCSFCDKRVTTRNQLVVHERIHTGERPHVCHICGKGFAQSSVLNTHMRLHTGRPEVCKICDQRFCRPAELRLHMRKHTGEKPFLCTECGQAFIQRSHLVEHNKTHSDLRPYQCTYCDKAFKQNSSLKSHIQIHLGCKPFKCSQCPYACRQSYSLTQHMKQHSNDTPRPERPHMCLICNKTFTTVAMLSSHASSIHNVKVLI